MSPRFDSALHMMEVQGGSFVRALAACYYAADTENKLALRAAFAKYFDNYEAQFKRQTIPAHKPASGVAP